MQTYQLKRKTKRAKHVQVGRGGRRGKTSGKGHKGQKSRAGHKIRPEIRDRIKSLPKLRGRGVNSNKPNKMPAKTVSLNAIDKNYKAGERVTPQSLFQKDLIRKNKGKLPSVKIVAVGDLKTKLIFKNCLFTETAKKVITDSGSQIK